MPTVDLPAMRSTRMLSAFSARQRSSVRLVMRLYLMPASGLNSKVVTTGPGIDLRDLTVHVELGVFLGEYLRQKLEFVGIDGLLLVRTMQQALGGSL